MARFNLPPMKAKSDTSASARFDEADRFHSVFMPRPSERRKRLYFAF